jgi:hypothetical protein
MKRYSLTAPTSPVRISNQNGSSSQQNTPNYGTDKSSIEDISAQAELAAQAALRSIGYGQNQYQQQTQQNGGMLIAHSSFSSNAHLRTGLQQQTYKPQSQNDSYQSQYGGNNVPFPTQSAPTQVLYEQARQAAVAKSNPGNARRPGLPSQRRPWSGEEENALMAGLDQVKGPHWSQILALYGAKGSISEILKDRNQVQLKDKARNLKLFFLKSNIEVPYYLQCVTGELKTRAPSQAARKEAEERARLASEDEQARFNGIMTLASGMSEHPQSQNTQSRVQTPEFAHEQPQDSFDSPEKFQVVEPENQESGLELTPPPLSEDEQFRRRFLAATAADTREGMAPATF